ncbi:metalloregulator ArsR/SmtB family transcription factor [Paenibacillus sp. EZ-K15]|uniref:ArsR/SmtB family transcription factor n=1 Tax=Paenibacillus sp. EZ-K15 TaxID=2044275 RepID=UPI000BFAA485|nr:metalloregulator ArsR/SmtB family transcription factor [Paenibacillus sp. EZ-K15]
MKQTTLNALAEPNRLQIVELLRDGPLTVGQIADRLKIRQPQTSKHLKLLHEAGMVEVHAEANRRIYRLRPEPLQEMDEWLESFRGIWEKRLDQLEHYLEKLQKKG